MSHFVARRTATGARMSPLPRRPMTPDRRPMHTLGTMSAPLEQLLRGRESDLRRAWSERVRRSSRHYAERSQEEIDRSVESALAAITACIADSGSSAVASYTSRLARQRLEGGFQQAETLNAFLMGRDLVLDLVHSELPAEQFVEAVHRVDEAFHRVVASYSASFCSLCTARQEERRTRLERHLESVVERSQDAMILFDEERKILSWNAGAQNMLGYEAGEVLGRGLALLLPEDQRSAVDALWADLRHRDHARLPETRARRKDGSLVWMDATYTVVRTEGGGSLGIWALFRDITGRKTLEEEKLQAERLALIGTMSAKLAHEVRNPLNSLVLGLDLVRDNLNNLSTTGGDNAAEALELIGSVESELQRIQRTVEHYLRFARLPRVHLEPLVLDDLLLEHLEMMRPDLERSLIELELDLATEHAHVQADAGQLWQAILNLVRNAVQAMRGGGRLRVATRVAEGRVEVRV